MKNTTPVQLVCSWQLRNRINHAGRKQHQLRMQHVSCCKANREAFDAARHTNDSSVSDLDRLVTPQLVTPDAAQLGRVTTVARKKAMHRPRRAVAIFGTVKHDHPTPTTSKHHRGAQPRGTAADHDHI